MNRTRAFSQATLSITLAVTLAAAVLPGCASDPYNPGDPSTDEYLTFRIAQCLIAQCYPPIPMNCELRSRSGGGWHTYFGNNSDSFNGEKACGLGDTLVVVGNGQANINPEGITPLQAHTSPGSDQPMLVGLRSDGHVSWLRYISSGASNGQLVDIVQVSADEAVALGHLDQNIAPLDGVTPQVAHSTGTDLVLFRINSAGRILWYTYIPATAQQTGGALLALADGSFIVTGYTDANIPNIGTLTPRHPFQGANDTFLAKVSAAGTVEWYTLFGSPGNDSPTGLALLSDGNIALTMYAASAVTFSGVSPLQAAQGLNDGAIVVFTQGGELKWYTHVGGSGSDFIFSVVAVPGGLLTGGQTQGLILPGSPTPLLPFVAGTDGFILRLTNNGQHDWHAYIGTAGTDAIQSVNLASASTQAETQRSFYFGGDVGANLPAVAGVTPRHSFNGGSSDGVVGRMNLQGGLEWYALLGGNNYDNMHRTPTPVSDGGLVFTAVSGNAGNLYSQAPHVSVTASDNWFVGRLKSNGTFAQ